MIRSSVSFATWQARVRRHPLNRPAIWLAPALLAALAAFAPPAAHSADSDVTDIDPEHQAMVAREKIKQRDFTRRNGNRPARDGQDSACGTVDIGNNNDRNDRSARGRVNPRETTVIVTGPVINTARCR